jgi:hypothetical protein
VHKCHAPGPLSINKQRISVGENLATSEPLCTGGEIINYCRHYRKTVWKFLNDPAVTLHLSF